MQVDHPLFYRLRSLDLPRFDYAVFGSGPLFAQGVVKELGDLDVLVRGAAWDRVAALGRVVRLAAWDVDVVEVGGGLTFGRSWAIGDFDVDELIDGAEEIDGLAFVALEHVVTYKQIADRPKDREHLRLAAAAGLI